MGELQSLASYVGSQAQRGGSPATPSAALQQALQEAAGAGATGSPPGAANAAGSTPAPLALQAAGMGLPPCFGPCIFCVTLCTLLMRCLCFYSALLLGLLHDSVYLPLVSAEVLQRPKPSVHSMYHARGNEHAQVASKMLSGDIYMYSTPYVDLTVQVAPQGFRGCRSLPAGTGRRG